jgi:hypothetical protein
LQWFFRGLKKCRYISYSNASLVSEREELVENRKQFNT